MDDLVRRAMRGDAEAFEALASLVADRAFALAYRILRDHHRAQDAAQQALIGAWRDLPTLREPERFEAWLYRIVVHACYVEARGERRWRARVHAAELDAGAGTTADPTRAVADRDELEGAFRRLSPEHRAVVVLRHHLGYPLAEIAAVLGIPDGTARSRLHYAVRELRATLDERPSAAVTERTA